jgi:hypothetical protein
MRMRNKTSVQARKDRSKLTAEDCCFAHTVQQSSIVTGSLKHTMPEDKVTQVYLRSDDHSWIPARQLKVYNNKATVAVPKFKNEQELMSCGRRSKQKYHKEQVVDLTDYPNNVLPMLNVDAHGNLEDYKDMVELPFMHEVSSEGGM